MALLLVVLVDSLLADTLERVLAAPVHLGGAFHLGVFAFLGVFEFLLGPFEFLGVFAFLPVVVVFRLEPPFLVDNLAKELSAAAFQEPLENIPAILLVEPFLLGPFEILVAFAFLLVVVVFRLVIAFPRPVTYHRHTLEAAQVYRERLLQ